MIKHGIVIPAEAGIQLLKKRAGFRLKAGMTMIIIFLGLVIVASVSAATPEELESQVKEQTERLEKLNREIETTENTLKQVQGQKKTLEREVKTLDGTIVGLGLRIKADETTAKKLTAEIGILELDLQEMGASIHDKKNDIARLFRELQQEDDQSALMRLLGKRSLSESLRDIQDLGEIRNQVYADIARLVELSLAYTTKIEQTSSKKTEVARRKADLENRKDIVAERKEERATVLQETKSQESVYQERVKKLRAEQDALEDAIEQIEQKLRKDFDRAVLPVGRSGALAWPVENYVITQKFGVRSWLYRGKPHNGLDLGIPVGTPVYASSDGTVMAADNNDKNTWRKYQYGKYVLVRHENNLATLYAHLSKYVVAPGEGVKRGDLLGYSGNTGYSTGPHLHLGLYWAPSITLKDLPPAAGLVPVGVNLDPEIYL